MPSPRVYVTHSPHNHHTLKPRGTKRPPPPKTCDTCRELAVAVSGMGYYYCEGHLKVMREIAGEAGVGFRWRELKCESFAEVLA